jgi:DNA invertase Pin-like site-specific DNA recombinase
MIAHSQRRAAVYSRVSTNGQTVANQLPDLRRYAQQRGWVITEEYTDEGISGAKSSRPALDRLMADARKGRFDAVLVWRFDRFARSTTHLLSALEEFRTLGVDFVSVQEAVDTSTPMGKMIFTVVAAVAELERSIINERVRAGLARVRLEGKRLGRPPATVDTVRLAKLRQEGLSVRSIAAQLGVPKSTVADVLKSLCA